MSENTPEATEDQFAALVAACDEALATGSALTEATPDVPPELRARLERGVACMRLLRQALPHDSVTPALPAVEPATPLTHLGRFELKRVLGRGGFGVVWLAHDSQLRRDVALKLPRAAALLDPELRQRFLREARAAAALDHPNVVPLYEAGEDGSSCYLASAYCPGSTLAAWLKQCDNPVSIRDAATVVAALAGAVEHAHSRGVLHRDLKPANVLLEPCATGADGLGFAPRVTDFGLAKLLTEPDTVVQTQSGAIVGTPAYMAPEQAGGHVREIGPAADVYALGAILYEMLTGRPPFLGETVLEVLEQVRSQEPVPPGALRAKLPRDLETICLKCLQKEPGKRYGSAAALAEDLRRFLEGRPIAARPVGAGEKVWRWCRRNPWLAGLIVTVILSLLAGASVSALFAWRAEQHAQDALTQAGLARQEAERATASEKMARHGEYVSDLRLIQKAWEEAQIDRVVELLDKHVPRHEGAEDLRSFEWYYWWRLAHFDRFTLHGHTQIVTSVAYSPTGTFMASGSRDGTVRLWNARTGRQERSFPAHLSSADVILAIGPEDRLLASACRKEVKVWNTTTQSAVVHIPELPAQIRTIAFNPNGRQFAGGLFNGRVMVWEAGTGKEVVALRGHSAAVGSVAFSPDGTQLASGGSDGTVRLWDLDSGKEVQVFKGLITAHSVSFRPDGRRLAAGTSAFLQVWDLTTGKAVLTRQATGTGGLIYSPDGTRLASAAGRQRPGASPRELPQFAGEIKVWDAETGEELAILPGHSNAISAVAFSPDGQHLASASWDQTIKVWKTGVDPRFRTFKVGNTPPPRLSPVWGLAFSPDGRYLAAGSRNGLVKVIDVLTGAEVCSPAGHAADVVWVVFSPDGRRLASSGTSNDLITREPRDEGKIRPGTNPLHREVRIWSLPTGQELFSLPPDIGPAGGLVFSPDGKHLACGKDKTVEVWDAAAGRNVRSLQGHTNWILNVAYSPDGSRLASCSGSGDSTVRTWDTATGEQVLRLTRPVDALLYSMAYSPDGKFLAAGYSDRMVRVWDAATGAELFTLKGHRSRVTALAFSPRPNVAGPHQDAAQENGWRPRLASGGDDGTVRVWELLTGQEILSFQESTRIVSVCFSPDGRFLAASPEDGTVKMWSAQVLQDR
jgi:WD40 repeat protein